MNIDVEYESNLEKEILLKLDMIPCVIGIKTQSIEIQYEFKGRSYIYYPDIQILTNDNKLIIVEVKPLFYTLSQLVKAKYIALKKYCLNNGFAYAMIDNRFFNFDEILANEEKDLKQLLLHYFESRKCMYYKDYKLFKQENNYTDKDVISTRYNCNVFRCFFKLNRCFVITLNQGDKE